MTLGTCHLISTNALSFNLSYVATQISCYTRTSFNIPSFIKTRKIMA